MKIGIVTLIGDNYGNKFQNYAVERLLACYGEVTTFAVERCEQMVGAVPLSPPLRKLKPSHLRDVLASRVLYKYGLNNAARSIVGNLLYGVSHRSSLLGAMRIRHERFDEFAREELHISPRIITHENCHDEWLDDYDYFVCGSDQVWNPTYREAKDLIFLSFAKREQSVALAPSFGAADIPGHMRRVYEEGLRHFKSLSVREEVGQAIIRDLTGREVPVLLDPTMALPVDEWEALSREPEVDLPSQYVLCYFLGHVDKARMAAVSAIAKSRGLPVVRLLDIEQPEYYAYDPAEALWALEHADLVLTDSFHGSVFSILFHRDFLVFERDEGGASMSSRLDTLLNKFSLEDRKVSRGCGAPPIDEAQWSHADEVIAHERKRTLAYLEQSLNDRGCCDE